MRGLKPSTCLQKSATMPAKRFFQTAASLSATLNTDLRCVSGAGNVYLCSVLVRVAFSVTLLFLQYVLKFFCKFSLCLLLITNELVIFAENHKN